MPGRARLLSVHVRCCESIMATHNASNRILLTRFGGATRAGYQILLLSTKIIPGQSNPNVVRVDSPVGLLGMVAVMRSWF